MGVLPDRAYKEDSGGWPLALRGRGGGLVEMGGLWEGGTVFLVCNGPSTRTVPLDQLEKRGLVTAGINNGWCMFRPRLWFCVDRGDRFMGGGWMDPGILKFVPWGRRHDRVVKKVGGEFKQTGKRVQDCPGVVFFVRDSVWHSETYMEGPTVSWGRQNGFQGDDTGEMSCRSTMLVAMRVLVELGFKRICLVGVDFGMEEGKQNYGWDQGRARGAVRNSNRIFRALNKRFERVKEQFQARGVQVWNCTPNSGLRVWPYKAFEEAVREATAAWDVMEDEGGWYEKR